MTTKAEKLQAEIQELRELIQSMGTPANAPEQDAGDKLAVVAAAIAAPPSTDEIQAALSKSRQSDIAQANARHEPDKLTGCSLCVTCGTLFRQGSQGPTRPKHASHKLHTF